MENFEGKVALVTGGGLGIGRATALAFARAGARVVIDNRTAELVEEAVGAIRAESGDACFLPIDVSVEADVKALVEHAVSTFGRLDVAFNNAGIEGEILPLVEHLSQTLFHQFPEGYFLTSRELFYCLQ